MQRLFIAFLTFVAILTASIGAFLFLSLLPHITLIGWAVTALLCIAIACVGVLVVAWTGCKISIMQSNRDHARLMRQVVLFESGAAFVDGTGNWIHLSAEHEKSRVPLPATIVQSLPSPKQPSGWSDESVILDLWTHGSTLETIVESTGMPYATVQKVTSTAKKNGVKRLSKAEMEAE